MIQEAITPDEAPTLVVENFYAIVDLILKDNDISHQQITDVEAKIEIKVKAKEETPVSTDEDKKRKDKSRYNNTTPSKTLMSPETAKTSTPAKTPISSKTPETTKTTNITTTTNNSPTSSIKTQTPSKRTPNNENGELIKDKPTRTRERNHSFIEIIKDIIISMSEVYKIIKGEVNKKPSPSIKIIKKNFTTLSALYGQIFEKTKFYDQSSLLDVDYIFWRIFPFKKRLSKIDLSNISIGTPLRNSFQHQNYVYDENSFQLYHEFLKDYFLSELTLHEFIKFEASFLDQTGTPNFKVLIFNLREIRNGQSCYHYIDYFREDDLLTLCRYFMAYSHCLYAILTRQLVNVPLPKAVFKILKHRYGIDKKKITKHSVYSTQIQDEIEKKNRDYLKLPNADEKPSIYDLVKDFIEKENQKSKGNSTIEANAWNNTPNLLSSESINPNLKFSPKTPQNVKNRNHQDSPFNPKKK